MTLIMIILINFVYIYIYTYIHSIGPQPRSGLVRPLLCLRPSREFEKKAAVQIAQPMGAGPGELSSLQACPEAGLLRGLSNASLKLRNSSPLYRGMLERISHGRPREDPMTAWQCLPGFAKPSKRTRVSISKSFPDWLRIKEGARPPLASMLRRTVSRMD